MVKPVDKLPPVGSQALTVPCASALYSDSPERRTANAQGIWLGALKCGEAKGQELCPGVALPPREREYDVLFPWGRVADTGRRASVSASGRSHPQRPENPTSRQAAKLSSIRGA